MKIQVFAVLKDYYSESFEINNPQIDTIQELKNELIKINDSASQIINACRFAINEEFVSGNFQLKANEHIYIIPPSSGG